MKKRYVSMLALLTVSLLVCTVFTGCGAKSSEAVKPAGRQAVLTFAVLAEPDSLDPQLQNSMPAAEISDAVDEGLTRLHEGKVLPGIAEKWDISPDGKTYIFHLRDAKWSDGKLITAQDFAYGIQRLLDPKTASPYAFAGACLLNGENYNSGKTNWSEVGVKALDAKTLEMKLPNPEPYFPGYMSMACFYPARQDLVEKYGGKYALEASNMVYDGPFILKEWKHEDSLTLEKNPDYWNKDAIKLDGVKVLEIPDTNTQMSMYASGELDFVNIPTELWDKYKDNPKVQVYMNGAVDWERLNLKAPGKPWLANEDFRKALNYAIDRDSYVKTATKGLYFPCTRLVLPMITGADGKKYTEAAPIDIYPAGGDTGKAKDYLSKAMKTLNISDPQKIVLTLETQDAADSKQMAEVLQDQLRRNLGITVNIKLVTYKQKLADDTAKQYDAIYNGWMPDYDDPMTYLELFESHNSQNSTGWSNPEYDKLVEAARTEMDPAKRQQDFWDAEKILVDECPFIPLQYRQVAFLQKDNLKGIARYFVGSDIDFTFANFE